MKLLRLLTGLLRRVETVLLVLFLGAMVVLAFMQVMLRNLFGTGFLWGDPIVRQMVMWAGFIGAALAASEQRHISIDAIARFVPPRARHIIQTITNVFAAVVCYFLAQAAWVFMVDERQAGTEMVLSIPAWIGLIIIPAGYCLLALHFALNAVQDGARALGRDGEEPPAPATEAL